MASSISGSNSSSGDGNTPTTRQTLPSLFSSTSSSVAAGKDLDSFMNSINDNALSQQIEFILQDTSMEQDEEALRGAAARHLLENSPIIKQENPPTPLGNDSSIYNHCSSNSQEDVIMPITSAAQLEQTHLQTLLHGRPLIIQSTENLNPASLLHRSVVEMEEEDPELNDENLQDIEEEAKAAEADEEPEQLQTQIKIEAASEDSSETNDGLTFLSSQTQHHNNHHHQHQHHHLTGALQGQPAQLVLPAGSIVSTTTRSISGPVSETLAHLQRRPVCVSSEGINGISSGTQYVRMPTTVISRSPMSVLNVVQDSYTVNHQQSPIILQSTSAMTNQSSNSAAYPVMISSTSPQNHQNIALAQQQQQQVHQEVNLNHLNNSQNIIINSNASLGSSSPPSLAPISNHLNNNHLNHMTTVRSSIVQSTNATTSTRNSTEPKRSPTSSSSNPSSASLVVASTSTAAALANSSSPPSGSENELQQANNTNYQCIECAEKFDTKELYDIHRSGHANNMKCAICNMVLKSLKNYEKHCLRCKPYECLICGRVVRFRPNFIKHMRVHTGQQSERHKYKCDVCQKEFMSFEYFKVHKKIHNENVNLTCEICGKVFSALASLRGHSKLHSGVKLHKCEVCGKGFGQRYNLKIHARTHTGDFPFECTICNKKLHTQSSLHTHMQTHQRDPNNPSAAAANNSTATSTATSNVATSTASLKNDSESSKNAQGRTVTSTVVSSPTSTIIIKQEPQSDNEVPSTSGLQQQQQQSQQHPPQTPQRAPTILNKNSSSHNANTMIKKTVIRDSYGKRKANNLSVLSKVKAQHRHFSTNNKNLKSNHLEVSKKETLNASQHKSSTQQQQQQQQQQLVLESSSSRALVIKNFIQQQNGDVVNQQGQPAQQQQRILVQHQVATSNNHPSRQVIQRNITSTSLNNISNNSNHISVQRQQQLLRKTPIIHSTSGFSNQSASMATVVQQSSNSTSPSAASSSSPSGSSTIVVNKNNSSGLTLNSAALGSTIIRSTGSTQTLDNIQANTQQPQQQQQQQQQIQSQQKSRTNHRNHHRRRQFADLDDEDDDDDALAHNNDKLLLTHETNGHLGNHGHHQLHHPTMNHHSLHHRFEDDDDFDEKSSPSLATTAIKIEPNFYSSGSGDNSNEMLIKEEVIFEDSVNNHSERSHSPPSSKFRMTNFEHDLVDHHVDLNHSLPPYGSLFEPHSIPVQLYPDDDDDFRLDHSSLGALHNTSNNSTNDGDYIKKEWIYNAGTTYNINGKFDEDSDALCEAANFIYQ